MTLARHPASYCGVERDPAAVECLREELARTGARVVLAEAGETGLPSSPVTVVYGEALLSMQRQEEKNRTIAEASRLLVLGGRFGIHELCFMPDDIPDLTRRETRIAMSNSVHGGIQPLTRREWIRWFEQNGLRVVWSRQVPMHLLEPKRLLLDEGVGGALRFALNLTVNSILRHRVLAMRRLFHRYAEHLGAISLVGELQSGSV